jgi:predicted phage tail protein
MAFFVALAISIAISIIAYLIMPKPKAPKPEAAKDLENPTAEAGKPIPVLFGTMTIKGINVLWFGDKSTE